MLSLGEIVVKLLPRENIDANVGLEFDEPTNAQRSRRMSQKLWNRDVDYVFSTNRVGLWVFACWPLHRFDAFAKARWALATILHVAAVVNLTTEIFLNRSNSGTAMEAILILEFTIITTSKHVFLIAHARRLEENILAATSDWFAARGGGVPRKIMKKYGRAGRTLSLALLCFGITCSTLYLSGIMIFDLQQPPGDDQKNSTDGVGYVKFPLPSSWFGGKLTKAQYVSIVVVQIVQTFSLTTENCLVDGFFYNAVMHLSGQFEILVADFSALGVKAQTETKHRRELHSLIKRHCRLVKLARNLQKSFSGIILLQLGLSAVLIAIQGYCLISSIRDHDRMTLAKSVIVLTYLIMQCSLYVYTGDMLMKRSEEIFHALFAAPWYNLPARLMKDVNFVMLKTKEPIRLSGGKFFVVSRSTLIYILKTAASYISVLQVVLKH